MAGIGSGGGRQSEDRSDEAVRRRILAASEPASPPAPDENPLPTAASPADDDRTVNLQPPASGDVTEEELPPLYRPSRAPVAPSVDDDEPLPPLHQPRSVMPPRVEEETGFREPFAAQRPGEARPEPSPSFAPRPSTSESARLPSYVRPSGGQTRPLARIGAAAAGVVAFVARLSLPSRAGRALQKVGSGLRSAWVRPRATPAASAQPSSPARPRSRTGPVVVVALLGVAVLAVVVSQRSLLPSLRVPDSLPGSAQDAVASVGESEEGSAVIGVLTDGFTGAVDALQGLGTSVGETVARLTSPGTPSSPNPSAAQAYRNQFGHSLDEDLEEYGPDVEAWLVSWRAAYERGEPWAVQLAR